MPGFLATTTARIIAIIVGVALLLLLIAFGLHEWQVARTNAARARLSASQTQAALDSGKDAVATVGAAGVREQGIDATTRENDRDIRAAKGADAPVDAAVNDAGLRALCMRPSYRGSTKCMLYTSASGLGNASARP